MMDDRTFQSPVDKVEVKQTRKGPVWEVYDPYGRSASTFIPAIGEQAQALAGTGIPANWTVQDRVSPDGRYTNHYLQAIEPGGQIIAQVQAPQPVQAPPPPAAAAPAPQFVFPQPTTAPAAVIQPPAVEYQRAKHPDEQRAIRRAVALDAAVATLPNLEVKIKTPGEVLAIAEAWERWLEQ